MAAENDTGPDSVVQDHKAHAGTYDFFVWLMGRATVIAFVIAALVVWLIAG